jgi:hypothetical protein
MAGYERIVPAPGMGLEPLLSDPALLNTEGCAMRFLDHRQLSLCRKAGYSSTYQGD